MMRDVPDAAPDLPEFAAFMDKWVEDLPAITIPGLEEWLTRTSYNEERKQQLRDASDSLKGGCPTAKQRTHIDSFVKSESYPEYKYPRLINSRSDAFKAYAGAACKAMEDVIYEMEPFIKHTPVKDRPAKIASLKQHGNRFFGSDYTAYESHFVKKVMESVEIKVYMKLLRNYPEFAKVFCQTLTGKNRCRTRSGVRYTVQARRMSGELVTSLGNGITNWCSALFVATKKGAELHGYVEGDDGIFSTTVALTAEDFARIGFTIKIVEIDDPCKYSFCGMIFADGGEIIREPCKFLCNFGWTQSFIHAGPRIMNELLRAKALSAIYETPQCPIVGVLARRALKLTEGFNPRFVEDGYHKTVIYAKTPEFNPSHDTRVLFQELFGVGIELQIYIESLIEQGRMSEIALYLHPHPDILDYISKYLIVC